MSFTQQKPNPQTASSSEAAPMPPLPMAGVVAAVQTAVSLMELSDEMVERQKQLRDDEKGRRAELLSFSALSKRMETALKMPNQGTEALRQVIGRIADAGRLEIDRAIDELNVQREGERVEYRQRLAKRCHALLQALVGNHTLPQGRRILSWSAQNGAGDAQIKTEFHRGLNTLVRVTLGHEDLWSKPVRVGELGSVQIPHLVSRPWAEPQWKQKKLDRFFIVNVSWTETQGEIIITRRAGRPSDGYHVSFDVNQAVTITAINENGLATEAPRRLDGDAGAGLRAVWMQILRQMSTWAHGSRQLVHAELNGDEVVAAPDAVAAALLATIEPVLMALGQARSHVCDGPLLGRIARLSEGHRQLLETVVRGTEPAEEVRQAPVAPNPSIRSRQRGASSRREIARRLSRRPPPPARNMPAAS